MAHVIIKCRVTFGKQMFNDGIKPYSICMRLVLRHRKSFRLSGRIMGTLPYLTSQNRPYLSKKKIRRISNKISQFVKLSNCCTRRSARFYVDIAICFLAIANFREGEGVKRLPAKRGLNMKKNMTNWPIP